MDIPEYSENGPTEDPEKHEQKDERIFEIEVNIPPQIVSIPESSLMYIHPHSNQIYIEELNGPESRVDYIFGEQVVEAINGQDASLFQKLLKERDKIYREFHSSHEPGIAIDSSTSDLGTSQGFARLFGAPKEDLLRKYELESNKLIDEARERGERIFQVQVNIPPQVVQLSESTVKSIDDLNKIRIDALYDYQTKVDKIFEEEVVKGINEQDQDILEARQKKLELREELDKMFIRVAYEGEARKTGGYVRSETYNVNRAKELIEAIREIDERYKSHPDGYIEWKLTLLEKFGDA